MGLGIGGPIILVASLSAMAMLATPKPRREQGESLLVQLAVLVWPAVLLLFGNLYVVYLFKKGCLATPGGPFRLPGLMALCIANGWLLYSVLMNLLAVRHQLWQYRRLAKLEAPLFARWCEALPELRRVSVRVLESSEPALFTIGWWNPLIVISRGTIACFDDQELHASLAHELAHVRHRDSLTMLLVHSVCPQVGGIQLLRRHLERLQHEFEFRADAEAARMVSDRLAVASAIAKIGRQQRAHVNLALGMAGEPSILRTRIALMLEEVTVRRASISRESFVIFMVGLGSLSVWGLLMSHMCVRLLG